MHRTVTFARLHTSLHGRDFGDLGLSFPSPQKNLVNLKMHVNLVGLVIEFDHGGKHKEILVPSANVVSMELGPEEKPPTNTKTLKAA